MKIGIGTTKLEPEINQEYQKIFYYCLKKSILIHSYDNYPNTEIYFREIKKKNLPEPKIITKILVNKNPFKKIVNIPKEIDHYKLKFNTSKLEYLQICNNPNKNYINQFILKRILKKNNYKFKKILLDCFYSYSKNIINLINDQIYNGIVITLNIFQSGASIDLLKKIKKLNKEIIVISPFAGGKLDILYKNLNYDKKNFILSLMKKYDNNLYNLNFTYLKSIPNISHIILGTKNFERFISVNSDNKESKTLNDDELKLISEIQRPFA